MPDTDLVYLTGEQNSARGWRETGTSSRKGGRGDLAVSEIYIKLVVGFANDQKVRALARFGAPDAGLARDLYVQMCLFCKDNLTDGFVPAEQIGLLVYPLDAEHGNQLAKQLASVGLTNEVTNGEAQGWQVLAYLKRNPSREQVNELSKVRAEAGRAGGQRSRKLPGQRPSKATRKQVANQPAGNLPPRDRDRDRDASNEASSSAESGGRHAVADELAAAFWDRHKASTAQPFLGIRQVIRTAIGNGIARNDVARALDHLAKGGVAISGGSITNAIRELRGNGAGASTLPVGVSPRDEHRFRR